MCAGWRKGKKPDVVGMDRKGTLYYSEMQKKNTGNLKKRSRYYQAQLDVSLLEPGSCLYKHEREEWAGILPGVFGFHGVHNIVHRRNGRQGRKRPDKACGDSLPGRRKIRLRL